MKTLLLGDVCPTGMSAPLFRAGDTAALFGDTAALFEKGGINLVNLECALTESDGAIEKIGPNLKAPTETAGVLKELGVTVAGLSNNHVFDYGKRGAADTLRALDEAGILHTGFGEDYARSRKDLVIEKDGERIAIIAVCEHEYSYALDDRCGSRPFDEFDTIEDIRKAKESADRVIVTYHGGKEHCRYPSPRLLRACRAMARNGADVVLCQHSHCIGCYELYEGCHILYGQGNFHFASPAGTEKEGWYDCLAVRYDTKSGEIRFVPLVADGAAVSVAKGEKADEITAGFNKRNESLQNGTWAEGWREFCGSVAQKYIRRVGEAGLPDSTPKQNHVLAHYLDCEAHCDVLRELFKTTNHTNEK